MKITPITPGQVLAQTRPFYSFTLDQLQAMVVHAEFMTEEVGDREDLAAEVLLTAAAEILRDVAAELAQRN